MIRMHYHFSPYAALKHNGKVVGYRFSEGLYKPYTDLSIAETAKVYGWSEAEVETKISEKPHIFDMDRFFCQPLNCSPYLDNKDEIIFYRSVPEKTVLVDENIKPLKEFEDHVVINSFGNLKVSIPCKKPENILHAVNVLDGILYGSDLDSYLPFWTVSKIDVKPEKEGDPKSPVGCKLTEKVLVTATLLLSASPNEKRGEDIMEIWQNWCAKNGVKEVGCLIEKKEKFFMMKIQTNEASVSPFVSPKLSFIGKETTSKPIKNSVYGEYAFNLLHTASDDTYVFNVATDECACGADYSPQDGLNKLFAKKYYGFHRMVVHNNELHDLYFFRHQRFVIGVAKSFALNIRNSLLSLVNDSILGEMIDENNIPAMATKSLDNTTGIVSTAIPMSEEDFIMDPDVILESLKESWDNMTSAWPTWKTKHKISGCDAFINYDGEFMEIGMRISIPPKF